MRILIERLDRKNNPTPNCLLGDSCLIPIPFRQANSAGISYYQSTVQQNIPNGIFDCHPFQLRREERQALESIARRSTSRYRDVIRANANPA
jgi:hypothetical protein